MENFRRANVEIWNLRVQSIISKNSQTLYYSIPPVKQGDWTGWMKAQNDAWTQIGRADHVLMKLGLRTPGASAICSPPTGAPRQTAPEPSIILNPTVDSLWIEHSGTQLLRSMPSLTPTATHSRLLKLSRFYLKTLAAAVLSHFPAKSSRTGDGRKGRGAGDRHRSWHDVFLRRSVAAWPCRDHRQRPG